MWSGVCCWTWDSCLNLLSQYEHLYGFSPVCTLRNNFAIKIIICYYCSSYLSTWLTWCAAPADGCWRRTWDTADTDEASLQVSHQYPLFPAAWQSWSSSTTNNQTSENTFQDPIKHLILVYLIALLTTTLLLLGRKNGQSEFVHFIAFLQAPALHAICFSIVVVKKINDIHITD